jgi:sugar lactone lactonase YvrE
LIFLKFRYGGGAIYRDLSTSPLVANEKVETLATLNYPPGNIAVAANGRIFFNYHPFAKAERFAPATVFELVNDASGASTPKPFPDMAFQSRYQGVFGMTVDRQNRLWFVEPCGLDHDKTRLLAFDLNTNTLAFEYWFAPKEAQFAQDLRVSPDGKTVFIADTGLFKFTAPSIFVFDIASKTHRKLLSEHPSTQPQDWVTQTPFGPHKLGYGLVTFSVGLDGIELSRDGQWLYYGAMNHEQLYKIPTSALLDAKLSSADLAKAIVPVGKKPLSDGITIDPNDNILITDIEHGGIARMTPAGQLTTLVKSPKVIWADGVVVAPNGAVLFTDSAIPAYIDPLARPPAAEKLKAGAPYRVYRFAQP